jgi:hypothetical protein
VTSCELQDDVFVTCNVLLETFFNKGNNMPLKLSDFSVLAYANNFTLWHYRTTDSSVTTTGYFNNASDMMSVGDLLIANIATGGTPLTKFYVVTANTGGVVTIALYS